MFYICKGHPQCPPHGAPPHGLPLVFDARALVCVSIVLTTDKRERVPRDALEQTVRYGSARRDATYYASRFLAALARPVAGASIAQYADAIDRLVCGTRRTPPCDGYVRTKRPRG
jgi:hypothetical protein